MQHPLPQNLLYKYFLDSLYASLPFYPSFPSNPPIEVKVESFQRPPIQKELPASLQFYMKALLEKNKTVFPKPEVLKKETFLLTKPPKEALPGLKLEEGIKLEEGTEDSPHFTLPKTILVPKPEAFEYTQRILGFLIKSVGRVRGIKLKSEGDRLHENIESIKEIYDGLMNKFMISNKTKEEKIKYVLRKSFKFMKEKLMLKNGMSLDAENDYTLKKKIEVMFLDHYFAHSPKTLSNNDYNAIKDMIMPFRKNSQNKTMNNDFLKKIFSFERFQADYFLFLRDFKEIAAKDNKEKLIKTSKKIVDLMATRQYKEFSQKYFKRMPWLEIWVEEAENIAKRLVDILPKKEEEEPIIKKQCLEKESLPTQKEEIKRPRFNSI